jgi:predicted HicB family RNase H-like nuclease
VPNESTHRLILCLNPLIRSDLQTRAMSRGFSLNELAKFVLIEYVKQSAEA